jgi:LysM repeat protein
MIVNTKYILRSLFWACGLFLVTGCNTFETRAPRRAPMSGSNGSYPGIAQAPQPIAEHPSRTNPVSTPHPVRPVQQARPIDPGALQQQELQANATFRNEMRMQLDQIMAENARLNAEIMSLRQSRPTTAASSTSDAEIRNLKSRIDALDAKLRAVEGTTSANSTQIQQLPTKIDSLLKKYQGSSSGAALRTTKANRTPVESTTKPGRQTGYEHIVADGETLSAIASAYEVSAQKIIAANSLTDPDNLKVNQKLFIPE